MKTARCTLTTWNESAMASGFGAGAPVRQAVLVRDAQPGARPQAQGKVIDLTAWRTAHPQPPRDDLAWDVDGADWQDTPEPALERPVRRARRGRRTMLYAELASTLAVVCAALTLIVRVLAF